MIEEARQCREGRPPPPQGTRSPHLLLFAAIESQDYTGELQCRGLTPPPQGTSCSNHIPGDARKHKLRQSMSFKSYSSFHQTRDRRSRERLLNPSLKKRDGLKHLHHTFQARLPDCRRKQHPSRDQVPRRFSPTDIGGLASLENDGALSRGWPTRPLLHANCKNWEGWEKMK